jgi:hypothetical protein
MSYLSIIYSVGGPHTLFPVTALNQYSRCNREEKCLAHPGGSGAVEKEGVLEVEVIGVAAAAVVVLSRVAVVVDAAALVVIGADLS